MSALIASDQRRGASRRAGVAQLFPGASDRGAAAERRHGPSAPSSALAVGDAWRRSRRASHVERCERGSMRRERGARLRSDRRISVDGEITDPSPVLNGPRLRARGTVASTPAATAPSAAELRTPRWLHPAGESRARAWRPCPGARSRSSAGSTPRECREGHGVADARTGLQRGEAPTPPPPCRRRGRSISAMSFKRERPWSARTTRGREPVAASRAAPTTRPRNSIAPADKAAAARRGPIGGAHAAQVHVAGASCREEDVGCTGEASRPRTRDEVRRCRSGIDRGRTLGDAHHSSRSLRRCFARPRSCTRFSLTAT